MPEFYNTLLQLNSTWTK